MVLKIVKTKHMVAILLAMIMMAVIVLKHVKTIHVGMAPVQIQKQIVQMLQSFQMQKALALQL
jgi:hypothetical protein